MDFNLHDLREWKKKSDASVRLGVLGHPVAHSLSPQMMNAALEECGLPHRYGRFLIKRDELREAFDLMRANDFVGFNLTLPHKIDALESLDYIDENAGAIGAVNTVAIRHGKLRGSNTDPTGFASAVQEAFALDVRQLRVVILGAGGAARAIAFACQQPRIWNRREQSLEEFREHISAADLIVNATPVGLRADDPPFLTRANFRSDQFLFDTIYEPSRTRLMSEAAAAGADVANGLGMLLHQGAAAFELWFNRPAPIATMRAALQL
ncbi:MAG: shikimate dehydrogenase [Verrucomicrobiota bacterium]|nr:shikimate dehydrogenase [Verrucomicrobiota bacterium]